jgi:ATP-binding cassette subfamily B protein
VEPEVERKAFARAWGYLSYNAAAKWSALAAAVATGVLYVVLLALLWLFADLVVWRGQIPHADDLSLEEQVLFAQRWKENNRGVEALKDLGLDSPYYEKLTPEQLPALPPREQEFLWQTYLYKVLRDERLPGGAGAVLPTFQQLPFSEQERTLQQWRKMGEEVSDLRAIPLQDAGFSDARIAELLKADPAALKEPGKEAVWNAYLYRLFGETEPEIANEARRRLQAYAASDATEAVPERPLHDRGILSQVVRAHLHNSTSTPVVAWLARWNPWMWKWRSAGWPNYYYYLIGLLIVAVVVGVLRAGASYLNHIMAARAVIEASTRLRRAVYHHTFRLGTLAFKALGPSEAVSIFTRHVEAVHDALYYWLTVFFREPVKFGLLLLFALVIHPVLALVFLLSALLVWLVGGQVAAYFRRRSRAAASQAAERLTLIRESLMMMRLVKVYLMELFNQSRVERQLARLAAAQRLRYRGEAIYRPLLIGLATVAALLLLFVGGLIVLHGQLGVAGAITLAAALVSLYWPAENFLEHRRFLRRGRESAVLLFQFLDRPGDVGQVVGAEFLPPLSKRLEFDGVSLREPGSNRMLLQNVTLTVQAGQRVGIIGADELEKHALVYLIPRFLDPTAGEVRIDEHNLRWVTLDSLRAQIAMVMQNDLVFNDTVANNIGCGDPSYSLPQIIEAAKAAHAHHFIQKLPEGYETPIGEMGHSLTLGQKFLIALARAILRDPAILIVEEPETPLDENTKALLDDTFSRILPGRTAIFLPHRISTIRSCDQLLLLHKGKIEAVGEHRELLAQNPLYRHLHYIEFNEMAEQV